MDDQPMVVVLHDIAQRSKQERSDWANGPALSLE
jgi:hypothetical protein